VGIHYVKVPEINHQTNQNIPQMDLPKIKMPDMPNLKERQD
jgi:hypothetical protein